MEAIVSGDALLQCRHLSDGELLLRTAGRKRNPLAIDSGTDIHTPPLYTSGDRILSRQSRRVLLVDLRRVEVLYFFWAPLLSDRGQESHLPVLRNRRDADHRGAGAQRLSRPDLCPIGDRIRSVAAVRRHPLSVWEVSPQDVLRVSRIRLAVRRIHDARLRRRNDSGSTAAQRVVSDGVLAAVLRQERSTRRAIADSGPGRVCQLPAVPHPREHDDFSDHQREPSVPDDPVDLAPRRADHDPGVGRLRDCALDRAEHARRDRRHSQFDAVADWPQTASGRAGIIPRTAPTESRGDSRP